MRAKLIGVGSYLPQNVVINDDFVNIDTSDEWIRKRTGIMRRCILSDGETTSSMCVMAAKESLSHANIPLSEIDAIIVATCTPDKTFPGCANLVQKTLNCINAFSFDIQAACAGFVYALSIANNFIRLNQVNNVMVIGADSMSKIVDWSDRSTCILFGDGAGAFILSATDDDSGIIDTHLFTDASLLDCLYTSGGVSTTGFAGTIVMDGKAVFEHAVKKICEVIMFTLKNSNLLLEEIDHFILHQANIRIIELVAKQLGINNLKMIVTIHEFANTSAASIPISFDKSKHQIKPGALVMLVAMGAGFNWGAVLLKI